MTMNKTDEVRVFVENGEYKKALYLVKGFRYGIIKEDLDKMKLAYECMVHSGFYKQIGTNTSSAISEGIEILKTLYGQNIKNN